VRFVRALRKTLLPGRGCTVSTLWGLNAATAARQMVEVRNCAGELLARTTPSDADDLCQRGWAQWIGRGRRRYLRLLANPPPLVSRRDWRGPNPTQPVRADQTCRVYAPGQVMGDPTCAREHRPLPE